MLFCSSFIIKSSLVISSFFLTYSFLLLLSRARTPEITGFPGQWISVETKNRVHLDFYESLNQIVTKWTHNSWIFSLRNLHILKFKIKSSKYDTSLIWFRSLNIKIQWWGKACIQSLINLYWLLYWILSWTGISIKAVAVSHNLGGNYSIHKCAYKELSKYFSTAKPITESGCETLL